MRIVFVAACLVAATSALSTIAWDMDEQGMLVKPDAFVALDRAAARRRSNATRRRPAGRAGRGGAKKKGPGFLARAKAGAKAFGNKAIAATKAGIAKAKPVVQKAISNYKKLGMKPGDFGKMKDWGMNTWGNAQKLMADPTDVGSWVGLGKNLFNGGKALWGKLKGYKKAKEAAGEKGWWIQKGPAGGPAKAAGGAPPARPARPAEGPAKAGPAKPRPAAAGAKANA